MEIRILFFLMCLPFIGDCQDFKSYGFIEKINSDKCHCGQVYEVDSQTHNILSQKYYFDRNLTIVKEIKNGEILSEHFKYDFLGRVVKYKITDKHGTKATGIISYLAGNSIHLTAYADNDIYVTDIYDENGYTMETISSFDKDFCTRSSKSILKNGDSLSIFYSAGDTTYRYIHHSIDSNYKTVKCFSASGKEPFSDEYFRYDSANQLIFYSYKCLGYASIISNYKYEQSDKRPVITEYMKSSGEGKKIFTRYFVYTLIDLPITSKKNRRNIEKGKYEMRIEK